MTQITFDNANLLDGEHPAQKAMTVVVEGDRIVAVGPTGSVPVGSYVHRIDLRGMTLMPGMVSGHFHAPYYNVGGVGEMAMDANITEQAYRSLSSARLALNAGYTSVVGAGTHHDIDARLAQAIESGIVEGPRFIPSTRTMLPFAAQVPDVEFGGLCYAADDFRKAVQRDIDRGATVVKILATRGHGADIPRDMTREEIDAVVETARAGGARVRAHVAGRDHILECLDAGITIIDHADGLDEACIRAVLDKGAFILPSLYLPLRATQLGGNAFGFEDLKDFDYMCKILPVAAAAGVRLVPGDDYGTWQLPHGSYSEELVCYVEHAGVSALEVIKWATKYGGELTGIPDLGVIAPGKLADLLIIDGDPSADIRLLTRPERIKAVIKGGRLASGALPVEAATSEAVAA